MNNHYYHQCKFCGANLDPDESCSDCLKMFKQLQQDSFEAEVLKLNNRFHNHNYKTVIRSKK